MNREARVAIFVFIFGFGVIVPLLALWISNNPTPPAPSSPSPPPARFELLGETRFGSDPDDVLLIECDHKNGTIIYINGRGGVRVESAAQVNLPCIIIEGAR